MVKQWKQWQTLFSWAPKSLWTVTAAMKLMLSPWKKIYNQPRQRIKKQRHQFADKVLDSQSHSFFSRHVQMWETIKKAKCRRTDAFELWCWRRLLRVPWSARRSNQSIPKELNPEYLFEGLMLKPKLQYFGYLMGRADSLEKPLMLAKVEGRRKGGDRGWNGCVASSTQWTWVWASSRR